MKRILQTTAFLTLIIVLSGTLLPLKSALAAVTPTPGCTPNTKNCYIALTTIPGATVAEQAADPVKVIKNIYGVSIGIAAALAVIMIIWAGLEYATVEAVGQKSEAKARWTGALYGLGLLLISYLILRTINVDLVSVNLDLGSPAIGTPAGSLQDALDGYYSSLAKTQQAQADITILNQRKNQKESELANMLDQQGSKEYQDLEGEIYAIREQIQETEAIKATEQANLEKNRSQVQDSTKATCYTVSGNRNTSRESCFATPAQCETARSADNSPSKTACATLTSAEAATKYQYCMSFSTLGTEGRSKLISKPGGLLCSPTPAGCQSIRTAKYSENTSKKAGTVGYINNIGSCEPILKTS